MGLPLKNNECDSELIVGVWLCSPKNSDFSIHLFLVLFVRVGFVAGTMGVPASKKQKVERRSYESITHTGPKKDSSPFISASHCRTAQGPVIS
jgi:hypothetical protein